MDQAGQPARLLVDAATATAARTSAVNPRSCRDVVAQRAAGRAGIVGLMLESFLVEGHQDLVLGKTENLRYGQSVTDPCLGWEETASLLRELSAEVPLAALPLPDLTGDPMRLATWNVNSAKQRIPRLLPGSTSGGQTWSASRRRSSATTRSPTCWGLRWRTVGTRSPRHGEAQWNGVAILSRVGLEDVVAGLPGGPGFPHQEARAIAATCAGIRVHSVYVPNGRVPGSEHYDYKLVWLQRWAGWWRRAPRPRRLRGHERRAHRRRRLRPLAYAGRPTSRRPSVRRWPTCGAWPGSTTWYAITGPTRGSSPTGTTARECSTRTAGCVSTWSWERRRWSRGCRRRGSTVRPGRGPTSDHAPVMIDLDEAPDGDLGPMVPPPSARPPPRGPSSSRRRRSGWRQRLLCSPAPAPGPPGSRRARFARAGAQHLGASPMQAPLQPHESTPHRWPGRVRRRAPPGGLWGAQPPK